MPTSQEFVTIIRLNASEAQNNLAKLKKQVEDLNAARAKAISSGQDSSFIKDLSKDLKAAKSELKSYETNISKTIQTLNSLGTSSVGEIEKAMYALKRQMKETTNPADYQKLNEQLAQCQARIDEFKTGMKGASAETENLARVMQSVNTASLNQLNQAKAYLEKQLGGMNPQSSSYSTSIAQLQEVKARIQQVDAEQQKLVTTIDRYDKEIEAAKTDMTNVRRETKLVNQTLGNLSGASIRDIEYSLKIIEERLKGMNRGTAEFQSMTNQAKRLRTELAAVRNEGSAQQSWLGRMADGFNKWQAAAMTAIATLTGLSLTIRKCVDDYAKMEDTMASTRKYTNLSDQAVRAMNEDFKKMDTRTGREQLNGFAGAAGRLGITSKSAIEEFVDGADKVSVALGDDLGDGAVDTIGKLAMAFGEDKKMGLRGAMLATGSALNEIAQNSSANAGYVVDFTARVAGMGMQAKLSQQNIMGYASVLDQNMQEAETSATAFGQLITKMYQDPAKFAKLAGENVKSFTKLLKTDANAALMKFFQSMQSKGGFSQLAPMFDEMGLSGNRCVGVLSTMATKLDDVKTAQALANKAYSDGTSVINEYNIMNETENAKLDKSKKRFSELSIELGQKLLPVARYGITTGSAAVHLLSILIGFSSKYIVTIMAVASAIAIATIYEARLVIKKKLHFLWNNYLIAGCKRLWTVLINNPYAAIAAAITAVIAIMIDMNRQTNAAAEAQKKLNNIKKNAAEQAVDEQQKIRALVSVARDEHQSLQNRITATKELNQIIPDYNAQLNMTTGKYKENKKALDAYLASLVKKYEIEGAKEQLSELGKQKASANIELAKANTNLKAAKNGGPGRMYTTTWGAVGNTTQDVTAKFQSAVNAAKEKVESIVSQENIILDSYGEDIKNAAVKEVKNKVSESGNGGGNSETEREKKAREKAEKAAAVAKEKAAAAALKAKRDADKADQAETNKQLAENASKRAQGLEDYRTFVNERDRIQIEGISNRKKHWDKNSNEYKNLLADEMNITSKHDDDVLKLNLKDIEKQHQQTAALLESSFYDQNSKIYMNEDALNEALYQNDISAMTKKLSLFKVGSEDRLNLEDEIEQKESEHQIENERNYQDLLQQYRERFGRQDVAAQEEIALNGLDTLYKKKLIKEKEYLEMQKVIKLQYAQQESEDNVNNSAGVKMRNKASSAYNRAKNNATADYENGNGEGTSLSSFYGGDIAIFASTSKQLEEMEKRNEITHAEHMQAMGYATADMIKGMVSKFQAGFEAIGNIMNAESSYYSAKSEYEQNVTTKKYEKLINAAGNNSVKKQKLQEKEEKELAKIKKKYLKKQTKIQIAQAVAQTAMSALSAYASAMDGIPYPANMVLAPIAAGVATIAGLMQVATIKKQAAAEEAQYYEGGFTGGANYRKKAGVVHEGEFVANHDAVNNSQILPALQLINKAQQNNTIGSLTATDVSRSLGQGGASVVAPVVNVQNDNEQLNETMSALNDVVRTLNTQLSSGIRANVSIDGQDGVKHQLDLFNKLQSHK